MLNGGYTLLIDNYVMVKTKATKEKDPRSSEKVHVPGLFQRFNFSRRIRKWSYTSRL